MSNRFPVLFLLLCVVCFLGCSSGSSSPEGGGTTLGDVQRMIADSTALDTDGDMLPDDVEAFLDTDPQSSDSDGDGIFDYAELFGDGDFNSSTSIPDLDGDGVSCVLDIDDDGDGVNDGEFVDNDGDGIANYLEYYGFTYNFYTGGFEPWDGDYGELYFKTDPNQRSTDQDPYDDFMEATLANMDVSVQPPGDYPMVPAYPEIIVQLAGYAVTLNEEVTWSEGESLQKSSNWERTVESSHSYTSEFSWEYGASMSFGTSGISATVSYKLGGKYSSTHGTSTAIAKGGSILTDQNWSKASTTNPTEAAHIKLFLKVHNLGTASASNIIPTLTLRIGGRNVATFEPGNAQINLLEAGGIYPSATGVYWVVDTIDTGAGVIPVALTMNELRALESGAPVSITLTQMAADVMQRDAEGVYRSVGDWNEYMARITPVSADLFYDIGDGNFVHSLVYAGDSPTTPVVTLGDAIIWAADGYFHPITGEVMVQYTDRETGSSKQVSLANWHFCFDEQTYRGNGLEPGVEPPEDFDLFKMRIFPFSTVIAKPPRDMLPNGGESFAIHYSFFDVSTGRVNVVTTDYRGIKKVEFIDKELSPSLMFEDIPGSDFYGYNPNADPVKYPYGYSFTGAERIIVTNLDDETLEMSLSEIYLPTFMVPVAPLVKNVRLDIINSYIYAQIEPDLAFFPQWVSTFYQTGGYALEQEIPMAPVTSWYKDEQGYVGELTCDYLLGDTQLVAYVQPDVYTERNITVTDEVYSKNIGQFGLQAHFDWTATDYYSIVGIDLDTGQTYYRDKEEGYWNDDWNPPEQYDVWLRWHNNVDWKLYFNGEYKKVTQVPDGCTATDMINCSDIAYMNRCDMTTDPATFTWYDTFLVRTD